MASSIRGPQQMGKCTAPGGAGGWVLYAAGVVYLVLGLMLINNHYFMPSLRALGRRLSLSDDVAGAPPPPPPLFMYCPSLTSALQPRSWWQI